MSLTLISLSETVSLTDGDTVSVYGSIYPELLSESVGLVEGLSVHQTVYNIPLSDSVPVDCFLSAKKRFSESLTDTVSLTETVGSYAFLRDSDVSVQAHLRTTYETFPKGSDYVPLDEHLGVVQTVSPSATDTVRVSDAAVANGTAIVSLDESVDLSELALKWTLYPPTQDTVSLSDRLNSQQTGTHHVSDVVEVLDTLAASLAFAKALSDAVPVAESLTTLFTARVFENVRVFTDESLDVVSEDITGPITITETIPLADNLTVQLRGEVVLSSTVSLSDSLSIGPGSAIADDDTLTVDFSSTLRIDGILNLNNYTLTALDDSSFQVQLLSVEPTVTVIATGLNASITGNTVSIPTVDFTTLGASYLFLSSSTSQETYLRIVSIVNPTTAQVDRPIPTNFMNGPVFWEAVAGVTGAIFKTTKFTNTGPYNFTATGLATTGQPFHFDAAFQAVSPQPQVLSAIALPNAQILVTFSDTMLVDNYLLDPGEYKLTGSGNPSVTSVTTVSSTQVALFTRNLGNGSYSLTVGTHTPHDLAGNPIDPLHNTTIFTSTAPLDARSIFTDFGPITRPALTLEAGTGITFVSATTVTLIGASIPASYAGYQLVLTGTSGNDGTYLILSVKTQTTVLVVASFTLSDADAPTASWGIVDPRDGEIANDPAHVSVTVNGNPVVPEAVVGLMGQIVLPFEPTHGDDIKVGYSWISNPTVEIVRLNSKEFRLNEWNQDVGLLPAGRHYRYNNVLPITTNFKTPPPVQNGSQGAIVAREPSQFSVPDGNVLAGYAGLNLVITSGVNAGVYDIVSVLDPHTIGISPPLPYSPSGPIPWTIGDSSDIQTVLPQPLLRDLKYRAYERAYTALLNDPGTLTLNAVPNRIAYPPLARTVAQTFVSYESAVLPELDITSPWARVGTGSASIVNLQLVVVSPTAGVFPGGTPIFWTQTVDQTFPHVFASTWDMQVNATPTTQGVFTGLAFGYSDSERAIIVGYLLDGTTAKIGIMVQGAGNDPSLITAWTGGLDSLGNPTNAPSAVDWTLLHSYRIYEDSSGNVSLYLDGGVIPFLQVTKEQLPFLEELAAPFNTLQGVFWGQLSAQAACTSTWDFVRYLVLPLNPLQTAPSIFVDYTANVIPEVAQKPWTPVGYHGTETLLNDAFLLLDSTSAVPATEELLTGLVGGDFRGYFRLEPLIATSAEVVVDFNLQVRTWTQGFSPNAMMVAVDDNDRLIQLSFVSDTPAPKFSYSGDGFPTSYTPPWTALGTQTAQMYGRTLQIVDTAVGDGLVYVIDDTAPVYAGIFTWLQSRSVTAVGDSSMNAVATLHPFFDVRVTIAADSSMTAREVVAWEASASIAADSMMYATPRTYIPSPGRTLTPGNGYILEARLQPLSFTPDVSGVIGAMAEVYDSERTVGFTLLMVSGVPQVALQGEGTVVTSFPFNWNDGKPHTYRVVYDPAGVVTLFVDGLLVGTPQTYARFPEPVTQNPIGFVAFGSTIMSVSTVNWFYCNAWRVETPQKFVGIWRGTTTGSLLDYWVPTKATGSNALILGNAMMDTNTDFLASGIQTGDYLIVDAGLNQGVYQVAGITQHTLTIGTLWPVAPSRVSYRIAQQTDWTQQHGYRIVKAPSGDDIAVFLDSSPTPLIFLTYDDSLLPPSQVGLPRVISGALPSVVWGAFDPTNLSQSSWQYVRYGVTRSPTELRIVPPHQVLNQRNLIASFERHQTNLPHTLTDFWSESEGIPPNTDPDFLQNPDLTAFTRLNEGTPLVPNEVLYSSLQVIERDTGTTSLIAPLDDGFPEIGPIFYQKRVCLKYDAETLPEDDLTAITPWRFFAQDSSQVSKSFSGGILTYGTGVPGTQTLYSNATPLPDAPSLGTQVKFKLKVAQDSSGGLGDSQIRFGFSAPGLTVSLALVTDPTGMRYVLVLDQNTNQVLGGIPFDFYDDQMHTYRLVRNPGEGLVHVFVDS